MKIVGIIGWILCVFSFVIFIGVINEACSEKLTGCADFSTARIEIGPQPHITQTLEMVGNSGEFGAKLISMSVVVFDNVPYYEKSILIGAVLFLGGAAIGIFSFFIYRARRRRAAITQALEQKAPAISQQDIDAILEYLPIFEDPSFCAWKVKDYQYNSKVDSFMRDLHDHGITFPFDWLSWQDEAVRLHKNRDLISKTDLLSLRKLLTTHLRKDRYSGGHFAQMVQAGHITAILRRLKQIRDTNNVV
jgi:hypothetical protein